MSAAKGHGYFGGYAVCVRGADARNAVAVANLAAAVVKRTVAVAKVAVAIVKHSTAVVRLVTACASDARPAPSHRIPPIFKIDRSDSQEMPSRAIGG